MRRNRSRNGQSNSNRNSKRIKPISRLILAVLSLSLLTGCWDRLEIEERAVVLEVGIDEANTKDKDEELHISYLDENHPDPNTGLLRVTVQLAVPGRIPLGPGQGGAGGGGGGRQTVWVVQADGYTIEDAINELQQKIASPLFFGHLRIIAVSDEVARKGIGNINDYFRRNPQIRRMSWMTILRGRVEDFMNASPELERVPALYLLSTMDSAVKMGRFPQDFLGLFWSSVSSKGKEGFLPYIQMEKNSAIGIRGLAYFRGEKMVGATEPIDINLFMGIKGTGPAGGIVYVQLPGSKNDYVMFNSTSRRSDIKVDIKGGRPHAAIKISIEGNINEKSNGGFNIDTNKVKQIEQQLEKMGKAGYEDLIRKTQKDSSDIFGFGELIRAKEPRYWNKNIRTKEKWQEMYKDLSVDFQVDIHVRRVGMSVK